MKNFGWALLLSLALHGLVAAWMARFECASAPDERARLDLASVELSIVETADDAPTTQAESERHEKPEAKSAVPPPTSHLQPHLLPPPEPAPLTAPTLPPPDTTDLPKPPEPHEPLETPPQPCNPATPQLCNPTTPQLCNPTTPQPCSSIKPDYPRESRLRGEQGDVTLEIDVNAHGTVDDVRVVQSSGFPLLDAAAVNAVRATRFTPAKSSGKRVASSVRLTLNFKLK